MTITAALSAGLRAALIAEDAIAGQLGEWNGEPAVFTRRPVPSDAPKPLAIINPPASSTDEDGLNSPRPVIVRDIAFYGNKAEPGSPDDHTRKVEAMGDAARELFHRKKFSVRVAGYSVIDILVTGPIPAPVDDEGTIGRVVRVTIRLRGSGT